MAAPKGNQFWKKRSKHGRDRIFASADILWEACCEYFEWVEKNPLKEQKVFCFQGKVTRTTVNKMRAMTMEGLCLFLDVNTGYFSQFIESLDLNKKEDKDFSAIITRVKEIIRQQKFVGAAADLLNPNIIARDLGLSDKKEFTGEGGGPVNITVVPVSVANESTD